MADRKDIRDGIKAVLESNIPGLRVYQDAEGMPREHPALVLDPQEQDGEYIALGGNSYEVTIIGTLYLYGADRTEKWQELDAYRAASGSTSIRAAIQSDPTLGGNADAAQVDWPTNVQQAPGTNSNVWVYSCEFPIRVLKTVA